MIVLNDDMNNQILVGSSAERFFPFSIKRKTSKWFNRGLVYWEVKYRNFVHMQYFSKEEAIEEAKKEYVSLITNLYNALVVPEAPPARNTSNTIKGDN